MNNWENIVFLVYWVIGYVALNSFLCLNKRFHICYLESPGESCSYFYLYDYTVPNSLILRGIKCSLLGYVIWCSDTTYPGSTSEHQHQMLVLNVLNLWGLQVLQYVYTWVLSFFCFPYLFLQHIFQGPCNLQYVFMLHRLKRDEGNFCRKKHTFLNS